MLWPTSASAGRRIGLLMSLPILLFLWILLPAIEEQLAAQAPAKQPAAKQNTVDPKAKAEADLSAGPSPTTAPPAAESTSSATNTEKSLWDLFTAGGLFMYPIAVCSLVMLAFAVERGLTLRQAKVVPQELVQGLGQMSAQGGFDPRKAYRLCQDYPSTLANVVKALLLKVGRPHAEVEQAAKEAKDSEATKLYHNVRPIALAQTIAPMLGLLGTVQGIIMAFGKISTANAAIGNKFESFAEGIYTALITTFAGLVVAIPAAILCSYFEGTIIKLFHRIDDVLVGLLPQVERYEGTLRINREQLAGGTPPTGKPSVPPVTATTPPPVVPIPTKG